ncbi:MAG: hypothetical protein IKA95_02300 [Clostridia bacterium]|nr:hypothetical protein [Clostridia bacterium]
MKITDLYPIINTIYGECVDGDNIVTEDLSNIVDIGKAIFDATSVDKFVGKLCDHIGKVVVDTRVYSGAVPSLIKDAWQYGAVKEKIFMHRLPAAETDTTWGLVNGQTYSQDTFTQPDVEVKFFDQYVCFDITLSIADKQVKSAFDNATQLNSFVSMIYNSIETALTSRLDQLIERTLNNLIAATIYSEYPDPGNTTPYAAASGIRAVNLLYLYNQAYGTSLTAAQSFHTPEFLRYAAYIIDLYKTRLSKLSTLFNIEGIERFTPAERMKMVFLGEFVSASKSFLYSDTFHESFVRLPDGIETVPYWQGTGSTYATSYTSEINLEFDDGNNGKNAVNIAGVIGIMFDEEAAGVSCLERNMTMHRNDRAQFQNVWEHMKAGYYNDFSENAVVFFVA